MSNEEDLKKINEVIAARFRAIEDRLESAESVEALFENLVDGVEKEFSVPFVWISLINSDAAGPVIACLKESDLLNSRFSVVSPELFEQVLAGGMKPVLANKDLQPFYRMLPHRRKYFIRSVAVVPFTLDGQLIGTWNNGDADVNRYESDMKTDLIEGLAEKLSCKLTKLVAGRGSAANEQSAGEQPGGYHD